MRSDRHARGCVRELLLGSFVSSGAVGDRRAAPLRAILTRHGGACRVVVERFIRRRAHPMATNETYIRRRAHAISCRGQRRRRKRRLIRSQMTLNNRLSALTGLAAGGAAGAAEGAACPAATCASGAAASDEAAAAGAGSTTSRLALMQSAICATSRLDTSSITPRPKLAMRP